MAEERKGFHSPDEAGGNGARSRLDMSWSDHEAWRALCQLDERERRGDVPTAIDAGALRWILEVRLLAEVPDLARRAGIVARQGSAALPWPLRTALAAARQGATEFRIGFRLKAKVAPASAEPGVTVAGEGAADTAPQAALPPITVASPRSQSAALRAAALVRAELESRARYQAPTDGLRARLESAVAEEPVRPPPIPVAAPARPAVPDDGADMATRLRHLEREVAALEARSFAERAADGLGLDLETGSRRAADLPLAATGPFPAPGIAFEVPDREVALASGVEAGLLHGEEADVTIVPAAGKAHGGTARPAGLDGGHGAATDFPRARTGEAEVEIVVPGSEAAELRRQPQEASAVERFLGALAGKR